MEIRISEIVSVIEKFAPLHLSEEWDNSGLQVGSLSRQLKKVVVSLDANTDALNFCKKHDAGLLVTHHPLIFKPLHSIDTSTSVGKIINMAIKEDISIYSAHTNLDSAKGGVCDTLSDFIGLTQIKPLDPAGVLKIGRKGILDNPLFLLDLIQKYKQTLDMDYVRVTGWTDKPVHTIGVCPGSGGSLIEMARESGCQVYITGDIKYHDARLAEDIDLVVLDVGHFASERIIVPRLVELIESGLGEMGINDFKVKGYEIKGPFKIL